MIFTRQADDLPYGVKGLVVHDENDDYTIFLNDRLGPEVNLKTLDHELEHIESNDFYAFDDANYIEMDRHKNESVKRVYR
jgi:hypothetical protein